MDVSESDSEPEEEEVEFNNDSDVDMDSHSEEEEEEEEEDEDQWKEGVFRFLFSSKGTSWMRRKSMKWTNMTKRSFPTWPWRRRWRKSRPRTLWTTQITSSNYWNWSRNSLIRMYPFLFLPLIDRLTTSEPFLWSIFWLRPSATLWYILPSCSIL